VRNPFAGRCAALTCASNTAECCQSTCRANNCPAADWSSVPAKVGIGCTNMTCPANTTLCCTQHATCATGNCTGINVRNAFTGR
jgi:hypothetical protein